MLVHRHERRDVQAFGGVLINHRPGLCANLKQVGVPLAEGVVDLIQHRDELAVGVSAEVQADRVEREAEQPRHGQQADFEPFGANSRGVELLFDLAPQGYRTAIAVIARAEGKQVEPVKREQPQAPVECAQLIEIEQHHRELVGEPVPFGPQPPVHHVAAVKGGRQVHAGARCWRVTVIRSDGSARCHGRAKPPSCSATASPACKPSS